MAKKITVRELRAFIKSRNEFELMELIDAAQAEIKRKLKIKLKS